MLNNLGQMHLELLQKQQYKKTATGDLIGNAITDASRSLPQTSSKTIEQETKYMHDLIEKYHKKDILRKNMANY